jgi:hypothetical protein
MKKVCLPAYTTVIYCMV